MRSFILVLLFACGGEIELAEPIVRPLLEVTPASVRLQPGAEQLFIANRPVSWVPGDDVGAKISLDGVYTAPAATGHFHVVAMDDAGVSAVAHIEVAW